MVSFPSIFSHRLHFGPLRTTKLTIGLPTNYLLYSSHYVPAPPPPPALPHGYLFSRLPRWFSVKNPPDNDGNTDSVPELGRSLEKEMATHPSILAWEIPWTEEPGRL